MDRIGSDFNEIYLKNAKITYDESHIMLENGKGIMLFRIDEIDELIISLGVVRQKILENYKTMSLEEKARYGKDHKLPYGTMKVLGG